MAEDVTPREPAAEALPATARPASSTPAARPRERARRGVVPLPLRGRLRRPRGASSAPPSARSSSSPARDDPAEPTRLVGVAARRQRARSDPKQIADRVSQATGCRAATARRRAVARRPARGRRTSRSAQIAVRPIRPRARRRRTTSTSTTRQRRHVHPLRPRRAMRDHGGRAPSEERFQLLRREALELALYTFKYVDGVDSVIALPAAGTERRGGRDGHDALPEAQDFARAAAAARPDAAAASRRRSAVDATRSATSTAHRPRTSVRVPAAQDGSAILVLAPVTRAVTARLREALRARRRGSTRSPLPAPGAHRARARSRRALVLPRAGPAPLPRLRARPDDPAARADASDDLVTHELCHIWQMQHRPVHMVVTYLTTRYRSNPYELRGAPRGRADPVASAHGAAGRSSRARPAGSAVRSPSGSSATGEPRPGRRPAARSRRARASHSRPISRRARATAPRSPRRSSASAASTPSSRTPASSTSPRSTSSRKSAGTQLLAVLLTSPFLLARYAWRGAERVGRRPLPRRRLGARARRLAVQGRLRGREARAARPREGARARGRRARDLGLCALPELRPHADRRVAARGAGTRDRRPARTRARGRAARAAGGQAAARAGGGGGDGRVPARAPAAAPSPAHRS